MLFADHAAVEGPDPRRPAVARFHRGDDFAQRAGIVAVAGENLEAEREALAGDDQADADLLAIAAVVARVAALCQWILRGQAFEVRAGHVVEQFRSYSRLKSLPSRDFKCISSAGLVGEEFIESAVTTIVVDFLLGHGEQVVERRAAEPVLGDVQFARRLAEPRDHQHRGHRRPRNFRAAARQATAKAVHRARRPARVCGASQTSPKRRPRSRRRPCRFSAIGLVRHFVSKSPGERSTPTSFSASARAARRPSPSSSRDGRRSPGGPGAVADRSHQPPVGVRLAVLADGGMAEIHGSLAKRPHDGERAERMQEARLALHRRGEIQSGDIQRNRRREPGKIAPI